MKKIFIILLLLGCFFRVNAQFQSQNDSTISIAMALINEDSVAFQLQWLQDMETRFLMASNHKAVAEKIKARFESYGMTEVRLDSFECYTQINYSVLHYDTATWQYNVEAKIIGSLYPDEEILVLGHHDNVQIDSNPEIFSPGADDNGSGTVAVLESARVLMQMGFQPERTLVFLTTAAEELMYYGDAGSEHYAQQASDAGRNLVAVINNDMIAYDEGTMEIGFSNVIGSEDITGIGAYITDTYTALNAHIPNPQNYSGADLQPFLDAGYQGLYLMERVFNPYYHTEQDLVENCDLNYLTEVIKISCGCLIYSDIHVGTEEMLYQPPMVNLYPNPCHDYVNINLSHSKETCLMRLSNTNGQLLIEKQIEPSTQKMHTIDMSEYPNGIYVLQLRYPTKMFTEKIIRR